LVLGRDFLVSDPELPYAVEDRLPNRNSENFLAQIVSAILVSASQHSTMSGYRAVYLGKSNISQQLVLLVFLTRTPPARDSSCLY
jgi:hypothetical protein